MFAVSSRTRGALLWQLVSPKARDKHLCTPATRAAFLMHMWSHLVDSPPEAHLRVTISKIPHAYVLHKLCIIYIYIYIYLEIYSVKIYLFLHNPDRRHWDISSCIPSKATKAHMDVVFGELNEFDQRSSAKRSTLTTQQQRLHTVTHHPEREISI